MIRATVTLGAKPSCVRSFAVPSKRVLTGGDYTRLDVLTAVDQRDQQKQKQDCGLRAKKHLDAVLIYLATVIDSNNVSR